MGKTRRIHLGIDYGTSASKIVLRDYGAPGGERATLVADNGVFRFSSSVALVDGSIVLGRDGSTALNRERGDRLYESVKMRVAGEVCPGADRFCFAPQDELPVGISSKDLSTLTVWWLISVGAQAARTTAGADELALGMTLGVPMSFFTDGALRATFLEISRAAWHLFRHVGPCQSRTLQVDQARHLLTEAYEAIAKTNVPSDQIRDWIRSEAEAAMWWAFQSPAIPSGPYAKLDIGAGTTNASVFRIVDTLVGGQLVKEKLAFFGAYSHAVGMDAIDEALAEFKGMDTRDRLTLRGQEDDILVDEAAGAAVRHVIDRVTRAFNHAWMAGYEKYRGSAAEGEAWANHCRIFFIGGGSHVRRLRDAASRVPQRPTVRLPSSVVEAPPDLSLPGGGQVAAESLPFVLVAYGLSALGLAIPEARTPDEIPPLPSPQSRVRQLDQDDIYAK